MAETHLRIAAHVPKHPFWGVTASITDMLVGIKGVLEPGSTVTIRTARYRMGDTDNLMAVSEGQADVGLTTPINAGFIAMEGLGPFKRPFEEIRALAVLPHHDYFNWAFSRKTGITSFKDIADRKLGVKIATGRNSPIGPDLRSFTASEVLKHHGISDEDLRTWGGGLDYIGEPENAIAAVSTQKADGVFHEGQFLPGWVNLANSMPISFLSIEQRVAESMRAKYGFETLTVPANRYKGMEKDTLTLDYGGFLVFGTSSLSDELAGKVAEATVLGVPKMEELYAKVPPENRTMPVPIDIHGISKVSKVPMHPGAQAYYRRAGLL